MVESSVVRTADFLIPSMSAIGRRDQALPQFRVLPGARSELFEQDLHGLRFGHCTGSHMVGLLSQFCTTCTVTGDDSRPPGSIERTVIVSCASGIRVDGRTETCQLPEASAVVATSPYVPLTWKTSIAPR